MIDSLRAGLRALAADPPEVVAVLPIDYAMVAARTHERLLDAALDAALPAALVLPVCRERPGHPVVLSWAVAVEVLESAVTSLRDVVRRDPQRNLAIAVDDGWVLRDLDERADLLAARGALQNAGLAVPELMARHRSRRRYTGEPVGDTQLRWLIDSARFASTSSYLQAYSAVVVRDPAR